MLALDTTALCATETEHCYSIYDVSGTVLQRKASAVYCSSPVTYGAHSQRPAGSRIETRIAVHSCGQYWYCCVGSDQIY